MSERSPARFFKTPEGRSLGNQEAAQAYYQATRVSFEPSENIIPSYELQTRDQNR